MHATLVKQKARGLILFKTTTSFFILTNLSHAPNPGLGAVKALGASSPARSRRCLWYRASSTPAAAKPIKATAPPTAPAITGRFEAGAAEVVGCKLEVDGTFGVKGLTVGELEIAGEFVLANVVGEAELTGEEV